MGGKVGLKGPSDAKRILIRQKENEALRMRIAGASCAEIAKALGYTNRSGPHKALERAKARITFENASELIKIELLRCDAVILECAQLVRANMPAALGQTKDKSGKVTSNAGGGNETKARIVDRAQSRVLQAVELRARLAGAFRDRRELTGAGGGPIAVAASTVSYDDVLKLIEQNGGNAVAKLGDDPPPPSEAPPPSDPGPRRPGDDEPEPVPA